MITKALYSLWSLPMAESDLGYNSEQAFIESMALSVLLSLKWFDKVELVTDKAGAALIKARGIPFTRISIELEDQMQGVSVRNWALGKIVACDVQREPFMHLDSDVFLFKKLPDGMFTSNACFQSPEINYMGYDEQVALCKTWDCAPDWLNLQEHKAYNCGIIGFNNLEILHTWRKTAEAYCAFMDSTGFDSVEYCTGLFFEQYIIAKLCDKFGYNVKLLTHYALPGEITTNLGNATGERLGYTHLLWTSKRIPAMEIAVRNKLQTCAPALANRLLHYYDGN